MFVMFHYYLPFTHVGKRQFPSSLLLNICAHKVEKKRCSHTLGNIIQPCVYNSVIVVHIAQYYYTASNITLKTLNVHCKPIPHLALWDFNKLRSTGQGHRPLCRGYYRESAPHTHTHTHTHTKTEYYASICFIPICSHSQVHRSETTLTPRWVRANVKL